MEILLILFVVALALAPLTHFLPSKQQRKLARMREYAAVHGLFVEFRDLPARAQPASGARARSEQVIYYGKRLPPSRGQPRERTAWLAVDDGWRSLHKRVQQPKAAALFPADVLAIGVDEGSCGIYWREQGEEGDVEQLVTALEAWHEELRGQ